MGLLDFLKIDKKRLPGGRSDKTISVFSPVNGKLVALSEVPDPLFRDEVVGPGIACISEDDTVYSPVFGKVTMIFPTKHAVGLIDINGVELIIHIGMDTVKLKGQHFTTKVKIGDTVHPGNVLMTFDQKAITAKGYNMMIPMVVTNSEKFLHVAAFKKESVTIQSKAMQIERF